MDLSPPQLNDYINFYALHKNWKELELLLSFEQCNDSIQSGEMCIFWTAVCCLKRGATIESRNSFKQITSNSDYNLASNCGLIETYLMAQNDDDNLDEDEDFDASQMSKLKSKIKKLSKTQHISSLIHGATYFMHIDRLKQARHYAEKALNLGKDNAHSLAITGWIYLQLSDSSKPKYIKKAASYFARALSINGGESSSVLPMYGLSRCYQITGKLNKAMDCMTRVIVNAPWFTDGLRIKSELALLMGEHRECIDLVNRILSTQSHEKNIYCMVIKLCYLLMFNGNYTAIKNHMSSVYNVLIEEYKLHKYPSYASLLYNIASITSKFVIHSPEILQICQQFMSCAVELEPENSSYLTTQANLYLYLGYVETAAQLFRDASAFDESNVDALCGAVYCRVLKGEIAEAYQEIQFLTETIDVSNLHTLKFLQAVVAWRREDRNEDEFNLYMRAAQDDYVSSLESHDTCQYFDLAVHDPRFCVMIVNEYLAHAPSEPLSSTDPPCPYLDESKHILDELCDRVPGMMDAHLLHAQCSYLLGDIYGAESILHRLKDTDASYWRAHLLQCEVALYAKSYAEAQTCLDTVIVLNFEIQTSLIYHLIKSKLLQSSALHSEAIELLRNVIDKIYSYCDYKKNNNKNALQLQQKKSVLFSKHEMHMNEEQFIRLCINIIVELSQIYRFTNQVDAAKELMAAARNGFEGENEMILIRLSEVRMLLKQNEMDAALAILHGLKQTRRVRLLIADIYLFHCRNKRQYIECFEELIEENPNDIQCKLLLGDAHMNVQQTSQAIECYQSALIMSDYDEKLALKFGRALITSHDYQRAILHFEATLDAKKHECSVDLKTELAELYIQFEEYDKAKSILNESLSRHSQSCHDLQVNIRILCLFSDLYQNVSRWEDAKSLLTEAWKFTQKLLSQANAAGKDMKSIENIAANVCCTLGSVSRRVDDISTAEQYVTKALEYDIQHEGASMEMAKLYQIKGNLDAAKQQLKSVLSMNRHHEEAVTCLVNIYCDKKEIKSAITELRLFRASNANNMKMLLEQIRLMKRSGEYEAIKALMNKYSTANEVGVHYIRGYVAWYCDNDGASAMSWLNAIRHDPEWAPLALMLMIQIYLYLSSGATLFDILHLQSNERHQQLEVCQVLLRELKYFKPGHDATLLSIGCVLLMASGNDDALDKAHKTLNVICKKHPQHILSHLAYGCCLQLKELENKATQFLNRFILDNAKKILFEGHEHFEDYKQLLLVLLQLQLKAMDGETKGIDANEEIKIIQKMCLDVLKNDASCGKAWQIVATVYEKQKNFVQAAKHYATAWKLHNKRNAALGYHYAKSLLRIGEYIECIRVAHKVLEQNKDLKQVQSIVDQALTKLRS
eukprot:54081_1